MKRDHNPEKPLYPKDHQELFEAYLWAELEVIHDRAGPDDPDQNDLKKWAERYAALHNLVIPEDQNFSIVRCHS